MVGASGMWGKRVTTSKEMREEWGGERHLETTEGILNKKLGSEIDMELKPSVQEFSQAVSG